MMENWALADEVVAPIAFHVSTLLYAQVVTYLMGGWLTVGRGGGLSICPQKKKTRNQDDTLIHPHALAHMGQVETGEALPAKARESLRALRRFQAGMQTARQLEFALFDMRMHAEVGHADHTVCFPVRRPFVLGLFTI